MSDTIHAPSSRRPSAIGLGALKWTCILVLALVQIYPIFWVLVASVTDQDDIASRPAYALPAEVYLGNFERAFQQSNLVRYLFNSSVVAVLTIVLIVALSAPAAYAISLMRFRYGHKVLNFFLIGIMIPVFVALLPLFQGFNAVGLRDTYWAVVLPQVAFHLPMSIYLYCGFMRYIPTSLIEAAAMDGASTFRIFRSIIMPLSSNTTITVVVYNFVFVWNEFVFANTLMNSNDMKTIPVGLNDFVGLYGGVDYGATYAAIAFAVVPTLILYFFLNKRVIEGMAAGAVRG